MYTDITWVRDGGNFEKYQYLVSFLRHSILISLEGGLGMVVLKISPGGSNTKVEKLLLLKFYWDRQIKQK